MTDMDINHTVGWRVPFPYELWFLMPDLMHCFTGVELLSRNYTQFFNSVSFCSNIDTCTVFLQSRRCWLVCQPSRSSFSTIAPETSAQLSLGKNICPIKILRTVVMTICFCSFKCSALWPSVLKMSFGVFCSSVALRFFAGKTNQISWRSGLTRDS